MYFKKTLLALMASTLLMSCMGNDKPTPSNATEKQYNPEWISAIPSLNSEIRACIITHKSTNNIRYAERGATTTSIILEKEGSLSSCEVDPSSYKVVSTTAYQGNFPQNLPRFYPYGKTAQNCNAKAPVHDERGRLMGTTCR